MTDTIVLSSAATTPAAQRTPVLSFPAVLLKDRFAYLQEDLPDRDTSRRSPSVSGTLKEQRRDQNDGKRWLRRKDNAHFVGNPHIVAATKRDYGVAPPQARSTFPEPLPPFLPRTVRLPITTPPPAHPGSANAGRFSLSLKGMRKELRRQGGRAEALVKDIEGEMLSWLGQSETIIYPDRADVLGPNTPNVDGIPLGGTQVVVEVSRTPLQLVWRIPDDAFARYVVHCCARYHEIVSFSKGSAEERLTYLLRPNVTKPDHHARGAMDTPPATESEYYSNTDSNIDSDLLTDRDFESDVEAPQGKQSLTSIEEYSPDKAPIEDPQPDNDTWSLVGDTDADVESSNELEIEAGIEALSIHSHLSSVDEGEDPDQTLTSPLRPAHRPYPLSAPRRVLRSASSPSRSPVARVRRRRGLNLALANRANNGGKRTLYEFLFL